MHQLGVLAVLVHRELKTARIALDGMVLSQVRQGPHAAGSTQLAYEFRIGKMAETGRGDGEVAQQRAFPHEMHGAEAAETEPSTGESRRTPAGTLAADPGLARRAVGAGDTLLDPRHLPLVASLHNPLRMKFPS